MKNFYEMFSSIKKIKQHRESSKLMEMVKKRNILQKSIADQIALEEELKIYSANRLLEQEKAYNNVIGSKVFLKDLDSVLYKVERMKAKEEDLNAQIANADKEIIIKEKDYDKAQKDYKIANFNVTKIEELLSIFFSKIRLEEESNDMSEIDDIAQSVFYFLKRRGN